MTVGGCARAGGAAGGASAPPNLGKSVDGVTLVASADRLSLGSGDSVTFAVRLENNRSTALSVQLFGCNFAQLEVRTPLPLEPQGKQWAGAAGSFKQFALAQGHGPGGVPATDPVRTTITSSPCVSDQPEESLDPGAFVTDTLSWRPEIVAGVAALPGPISFSITAGIDPQSEVPSYAPDYADPKAAFAQTYISISVPGELTIDGSAPNVISAGQAIDALLADGKFSGWLDEQEPGTCNDVNLFLYGNDAGGNLGKGPAWEIDLFCLTGVPRHFAIASIGAVSGALQALDFCDDPCVR